MWRMLNIYNSARETSHLNPHGAFRDSAVSDANTSDAFVRQYFTAALDLAVKYANERIVFDRPIGMNQAIQFPLADAYSKLEVACLMAYKGAWLYDRGMQCGEEANIAKIRAAEAGFEACDAALQAHGGMGYAKEFHVERLWREIRLYKIAPVSQEMALSYIGEHVLNLPKSY